MDWLTAINTYWSPVEVALTAIGIAATVYLFFNDPLRRWRFFGYRPTAIVVLFDSKIKKVLLIQHYDWAFPQGGIYSDDFYTTVEQTLARELGISTNQYALQNVKPVGTAKGLGHHWGPNRASLNTFSLRKSLVGKGYLACFVRTDLKKILPKIKIGFGFQKVGLFTPTQAEKLINTADISPAKRKIHRRCLIEVQKLLA